MNSTLFLSKQEDAAAHLEPVMVSVLGCHQSASPKIAGMTVDPNDLSPSDGESTSRSSSPNTSTHATCGGESVDNDGQQESSKGSTLSTSSSDSQDDIPRTAYQGCGLRRNNHDFTATFDFIKKATRQRKAKTTSKLEEGVDGHASVVSASREYLSEYYGWRPTKPQRSMPRSNFFGKDVGHEMIAASDCSEHESDKEVEEECEGSGDVYYRRGRASSTRGKSST